MSDETKNPIPPITPDPHPHPDPNPSPLPGDPTPGLPEQPVMENHD